MATGDGIESVEMEPLPPPPAQPAVDAITGTPLAPLEKPVNNISTTLLQNHVSNGAINSTAAAAAAASAIDDAITRIQVLPPANTQKPLTLSLQHEAVIEQRERRSSSTGSSILPALPSPSPSRQLFEEAAADHGANESTAFLQHELSGNQLLGPMRSASSTLDASVSRNPSSVGRYEKKIGHRRVDNVGEVTYKKIQSKQIMGSIQLGIQQTVGILASKPKRDLLMNDFWEMETVAFPPDGSSITPAHHYSEFRFKVYAPIAFRYFRDLFGIQPDDFLMSMCAAPLRELSNPGASGSIFYLTNDDEFIIKTVQKKECEFLQKLLPGYYMNLSQNPRTLLPKFFGLYCFHLNAKNVRLVAMNNLLPSDIKMHAKYDLKGSTFRRKASKAERSKASPTFKDLDFMEHHPNGIFLETDKYTALMKTIQRDCMVLESFQIMDYSLLVGIHNLDIAAKEKREERIRNARAKLQRRDEQDEEGSISFYADANKQQSAAGMGVSHGTMSNLQGASSALNRTRSMNRPRLVAHSTAIESITADIDMGMEDDDEVPAGGIPARSENDERLLLFIGIIDILQSYRLEKKLEHTFKSILYNGDTVSVCRPSFYSQRFQNFMAKSVFKKTPTFKHSPSKRKTSTATMRDTPQRTPSNSLTTHVRPVLAMSGSSTPPPAFDDISEEDVTANASSMPRYHQYVAPSNYVLSNRSVTSGGSELSDDDDLASGSGTQSPFLLVQQQQQQQQQQLQRGSRSPRLSKTSVQLTSVGCDDDNNPTGSMLVPDHNTQQQQEEIITTTSSTTTAVVKSVQAQKYTTTLVVNDVVR